MAGVGDGELVDGHGADRRDDIVEPVIERPVPDGQAELGVVGAAEAGEPGPVVARMPGGEHRLALGDAQRVRRDPGMKRQARIRPGDLGAEELADGAEQARTGGLVVGRRNRAGGVLQGVRDRHGRGVSQRQQHVPFLLAHAAAEHGELDRRLGARQVPRGLLAAQQSPAHGAVQLPPPLGGLVRRDAAALGVARHQLGAGTETADGLRRAEPPGLGAQPAKVVHGVTAIGELPVQHPLQPVPAHDEVAGAEIAVHQSVRRGRRPVAGEPPQADLERGPWLGEALVEPGHLAECVDPAQAGDGPGIHLVDPGQDLTETARETGPDGRVRVVPQQPPRDRLPVQALHQQVGPAGAEGFGPGVVELGHRNAGRPGRDHGRRLDGHVPVTTVPVRVTEQDQAMLFDREMGAAGRPGLNAPALPARAARQPLDAGDLGGRPPHGLQTRRQKPGQPRRLGHEPAASSVSWTKRSPARSMTVKSQQARPSFPPGTARTIAERYMSLIPELAAPLGC